MSKTSENLKHLTFKIKKLAKLSIWHFKETLDAMTAGQRWQKGV